MIGLVGRQLPRQPKQEVGDISQVAEWKKHGPGQQDFS